ncbi:hypothetical protein IE53DRAFT_66875 [Violaceomyces palustris]|uniref:Uncharacterized protein n=1 Tax=Violaceomyces palustris TaxID=1673888 RepID=A0ACD0NZ27_9BASI|nr:hypothetical protein IE53DRAFT_66875 [Violaceomyces palustris]
MSQPYTAAIVVGSIFAGLALLFFGYKGYKKIWNMRHKDHVLPPIREPPTAYYSASMNSSPYVPGLLSPTNVGSPTDMPSSPSSALAERYDGNPPLTTLAMGHARPGNYSTISSTSSTMTLKKSYAPSLSNSLHSLTLPPGPAGLATKRESYLPHSPLNRESIQIIPPQPLGYGFGAMALATDQRTLAFSRSSGVGSTAEEFSNGFFWNSSDAREQHPVLQEEQRQRYLQKGPEQMFEQQHEQHRPPQAKGEDSPIMSAFNRPTITSFPSASDTPALSSSGSASGTGNSIFSTTPTSSSTKSSPKVPSGVPAIS